MTVVAGAFRMVSVESSGWASWNALVDSSPSGTYYHRSPWLRALREHMGQAVEAHLIQDDNGRTLAGITFLPRSAYGFHWCTKPWATLYSGVIVSPELGDDDLVGLFAFIRRRLLETFHRVHLVQYIAPETVACSVADPECVSRRLSLVVDARDIDSLWNRLDKQLRSNIRSAGKAGLTVERTDRPELLLEFYRKSYARQGIALSFSAAQWNGFVGSLLREAGTDIVYVVGARGQPTHAILVGRDSRRTYLVLAGMDRDISRRYSGEFLWWEVIRAALETRKDVDLGATGTPGIAAFKSKFRPREVAFAEVGWWRSPLRRLQFQLMDAARRARRRPGSSKDIRNAHS